MVPNLWAGPLTQISPSMRVRERLSSKSGTQFDLTDQKFFSTYGPSSGLLSNRDGPDPGCYWDGNSAWLAEERTTQARSSSSGAACAGSLLLWAVPSATHWHEQKQSGLARQSVALEAACKVRGPRGCFWLGCSLRGPCFLEGPVKSTLPTNRYRLRTTRPRTLPPIEKELPSERSSTSQRHVQRR